MRNSAQIEKHTAESGAALLIAIFALLLISVVAIALVVTSGTDAALGGNYRTSTAAYYAALAGLEEARGRLSPKNPNCLVTPVTFTCPSPAVPVPAAPLPFIPVTGMGRTDVRYILNPGAGETVDPLSANPSNYPDTEYQTEFGWPLTGASIYTTASLWQANIAGLPGPSFKWVRVTPATEKSLNMDVNGDGTKDPIARLYFEPSLVDNSCNPNPGLLPEGYVITARCGLPQQTSPTLNAAQVLEVTSLAALPNGSRRMLQYVVAPFAIASYLPCGSPTAIQFVVCPPPAPPFPPQPVPAVPAALTLLNSNPATSNFQISAAPAYFIDGRDQCSGTPPTVAVNSIGYTNPSDHGMLVAQMTPYASQYPGYPLSPTTNTPTSPSLPSPSPPFVSSVPQSWLMPTPLDSVAQSITNNADVVLTGPANSAAIAAAAPTMSAANPMTIVVNGDLTLNAGIGYGLLLVTGTLTYQPFASWNGLILVIGKGSFVYNAAAGSGGILGGVVVAATRDGGGHILPGTVLGPPSFVSLGNSTNAGIAYSSCWIKSATNPLGYKILSFREIPLTN